MDKNKSDDYEEIATDEAEFEISTPKKKTSSIKEFISSKSFYIYLSQTLSAWGDRMWQFAVGLFLVDIAQNSLQLTAIYGFVSGGAVLLFGAILGDWVDRSRRLLAARTTLIINNVSIILCAVTVVILIVYKQFLSEYENGVLYTAAEAVIIILAVVANLASTGNKICIGRDWIVVICGSDTHNLTTMSARLRRIDLVTNILAPIGVGQIMTFGSMMICAIFIAVWNLISMIIEYYLLWRVYKRVPELAFKAGVDDTTAVPKKSKLQMMFGNFIVLHSSWKLYMKQPVVFAGLSLSCLYMTVLGFDSVTTGYAYSQKMSESLVGIMMGLGAVTGILGTFTFQACKRILGLVRTGLYSVNFFILVLTLCVASVFAPGSSFEPDYFTKPKVIPSNITVNCTNLPSNTSQISCINDSTMPSSYLSLGLLMAGIVLGRAGLWMTDLSISQQFLEQVQETERGKVNGVQSSLNMLMDMLKFGLVIALPDPPTFGYLVIVSFAFICLSSFLYSIHVYRVRGHILPHGLLKPTQRYITIMNEYNRIYFDPEIGLLTSI